MFLLRLTFKINHLIGYLALHENESTVPALKKVEFTHILMKEN